jgi:hypothetical protein
MNTIKFFRLFSTASALALVLLPVTVNAQSIQIVAGINYAKARQLLIQAGWQPMRLASFDSVRSHLQSEAQLLLER